MLLNPNPDNICLANCYDNIDLLNIDLSYHNTYAPTPTDVGGKGCNSFHGVMVVGMVVTPFMGCCGGGKGCNSFHGVMGGMLRGQSGQRSGLP